jgi:broad specificity phosphatase PhoE
MLGEEKSSDIVLIRHAQSTFNEASRDVAGRLGLFGTFPDFAKNEQFRKEVCYCSDHIDAQLSYHGIHQCTDTKQKMSSIDVDAIIVSPQIRALETCRRVFEGKKIPVIVEPDLTEVLRYSCDISIPIKIKETLYPEYNFSKVIEIGDEWYIKTQPPTTQ